jgi:hypothetical protein
MGLRGSPLRGPFLLFRFIYVLYNRATKDLERSSPQATDGTIRLLPVGHEENNAENYSPCRFSSAALGCTANMALQHGVGLLSERRTGSGPTDNPCSSHREKDLSVPWYAGFDP